ncbi:MAG: hypothetical protein HW421_559 [Ignavibacteria bacterium]|nr:hypothetical protein [Ignavibacteria bacterium]
MKEIKKIPKKTLKYELLELEKEELIEVIIEMTKINPKNKEFLDVFLKGSDGINFDAMITDAKKKIYRFIYGTSVYSNNHLKLREAKKVISDNAKILKDYPQHIADLKLYYVETCNAFTKDFGDISSNFYNSIDVAFDDFCSTLNKYPHLYNMFSERLKILYERSRNIGWGFSDFMEDYYFRLKNEFEKGK